MVTRIDISVVTSTDMHVVISARILIVLGVGLIVLGVGLIVLGVRLIVLGISKTV